MLCFECRRGRKWRLCKQAGGGGGRGGASCVMEMEYRRRSLHKEKERGCGFVSM